MGARESSAISTGGSAPFGITRVAGGYNAVTLFGPERPGNLTRSSRATRGFPDFPDRPGNVTQLSRATRGDYRVDGDLARSFRVVWNYPDRPRVAQGRNAVLPATRSGSGN